MKPKNLNKILTLVFLILVNYSFASIPIPLNLTERAHLRTRLENLFNEVDLLVKNQKVDQADLKKQERNLATLKVYERIPFQLDLEGLKKDVIGSAKASQVKVIRFQTLKNPEKKSESPPEYVFTDAPEFHLSENQLIEKIPFKVTVAGPLESVRNWTHSWPTQQMRLAEARGIRRIQNNRWEISANAFRFRDVKFPTLQPRPPKELLPSWARKNLEKFSESEPLLWSFVTRIEKISPQTGPFYRIREKLLLNDARMNFFLSKALKP